MARAIMLMGTGSDVGKSLIVAGLCRAYADRGLHVRPFKPQNMSNNAAVCCTNGEIGRAQALQARAARVDPSVHMNPILLKPESSGGAQVIVQGKRHATMSAREFFRSRSNFMPAVIDSFRRLAGEADLVVVEGAGSPAETNLRDGDLANMGFATAVDMRALLIGDIHRGGVIASIVGTLAVLDEFDRKRLKGFIINKFHGDPDLFSEGRNYLERATDKPCLGIVPHFQAAAKLPSEDTVGLENSAVIHSNGYEIVVLRLPRIANFDDLDPLRLEPGVSLRFLEASEAIPGTARLVIIPGSKSTIGDLSALREAGWDIDLAAHVRRGGQVLGLCGGYQMLGRVIHDPDGIEGTAGSVAGLRLLDVETTLNPDKTLSRISGTHVPSGAGIEGYEIHLGRTTGPDCSRPFAILDGKPDGAIAAGGRIAGTYLHGCFSSDPFRRAFLASLGASASDLAFEDTIEETLSALGRHLETHLDLDRILELAGPV